MPQFLRNCGRGDIRGWPAGRLSLFLGCARGATGLDFAFCGKRGRGFAPSIPTSLLKKAGPKTFFVYAAESFPRAAQIVAAQPVARPPKPNARRQAAATWRLVLENPAQVHFLAVGPEALQVVEISGVFMEHVDDDVRIVQNDPVLAMIPLDPVGLDAL